MEVGLSGGIVTIYVPIISEHEVLDYQEVMYIYTPISNLLVPQYALKGNKIELTIIKKRTTIRL